MELKSTDLLKVLQRAHEKEPAKVEEPVAPVVEEEHGGPVEEGHHEFRATQQDLFPPSQS